VYDGIEPFDIENDRMAELLTPLQAVLKVTGGPKAVEVLKEYAKGLDERDKQQEMQSPEVRMLNACREIYDELGVKFLPTSSKNGETTLQKQLVARKEEPWAHWSRGERITPEAIANLLREFGIRSERNKAQTAKGYYRQRFEEAWARYLAPHPIPPKYPANRASPASHVGDRRAH
jgi:hypothetical protein